jgi:hypothetical protein
LQKGGGGSINIEKGLFPELAQQEEVLSLFHRPTFAK